MRTTIVAGYPIAPEILSKRMPVIDIRTGDASFATALVGLDRFVFALEEDPSVTPRIMDGMAWSRKAIVARGHCGIVTYVESGGQCRLLKNTQSPLSTELVHNVPAMTLAEFSMSIGVEQWSIVKMSGDRMMPVLAELPGPLAQSITLEDTADEDVTRHLSQWYQSYADRRFFILKGLA